MCCTLQGYLLISERNKLKQEYFGLEGKQIAAAKQRGEVRFEPVTMYCIASAFALRCNREEY